MGNAELSNFGEEDEKHYVERFTLTLSCNSQVQKTIRQLNVLYLKLRRAYLIEGKHYGYITIYLKQ